MSLSYSERVLSLLQKRYGQRAYTSWNEGALREREKRRRIEQIDAVKEEIGLLTARLKEIPKQEDLLELLMDQSRWVLEVQGDEHSFAALAAALEQCEQHDELRRQTRSKIDEKERLGRGLHASRCSAGYVQSVAGFGMATIVASGDTWSEVYKQLKNGD